MRLHLVEVRNPVVPTDMLQDVLVVRAFHQQYLPICHS